jgi:hypothetical protein
LSRAGRTKLFSMMPLCRCFARRVNAADRDAKASSPNSICGVQGTCFKSRTVA